MKRLRYIELFAFSFLIFCVSCTKNSLGSDPDRNGADDGDLIGIEIGTKITLLNDTASGDYTSNTYRAQLFYQGYDPNKRGRLDSLITPYSGTYCDPKGDNTWLTPCAVDADYGYDSSASPAEDSQYGLRAGWNYSYYLFLSSPATPYVKYAEAEKTFLDKPGSSYHMEYWGLPYRRSGAAKDHPAVSAPAIIRAYGLPVQGKYIYSLDGSMILKEYRSRIAFSVRCGDAISHANFKQLELKGLRSNAVFRPFQKDFFFVDEPSNYENEVVYEYQSEGGLRLDRGGSEGSYTEGPAWSLTGPGAATQLADRQTNTHFAYILNGDYKTLDASNNYINKPAELQITLASDEGHPITLDPVPLSFIFEPQKSYFYLITINSVYLSIDVYARDWDFKDPASTSSIIDDDSVEWSLTIGIKDWTKIENSAQVDPGQGGDDAEKYDKSTEGITTDDWNAPSGGSSTID